MSPLRRDPRLISGRAGLRVRLSGGSAGASVSMFPFSPTKDQPHAGPICRRCDATPCRQCLRLAPPRRRGRPGGAAPSLRTSLRLGCVQASGRRRRQQLPGRGHGLPLPGSRDDCRAVSSRGPAYERERLELRRSRSGARTSAARPRPCTHPPHPSRLAWDEKWGGPVSVHSDASVLAVRLLPGQRRPRHAWAVTIPSAVVVAEGMLYESRA